MNFTLFKVNNPKRLKKLNESKISFFKKHEGIELFHFNKMDLDMCHLVYQIKDEYQVGTKRVGNQINLPFTQFINCFFFSNNEYLLIEEVLKEYQDDVLKHIQKKVNVMIENKEINNIQFLNIQSKLQGFIKKVEYINEDEEDIYLDSISTEKLKEISSENILDRLTLSIENQYVSIYRNGRISVDNSDEQFLIKFTKDIIDAITIHAN